MDITFHSVLHRINDLANGFLALLPGIVAGVIVYALCHLTGKGLKLLVQRTMGQRRRHRNVGLVLGRVVQGCAIVLGILLAATVAFPTFTPGRLIEVLGIGSVAIGFAFRDILQNYLAGILLLLTEPFRIGDQIIVQSYEGTVEEIQTRATTIKTYDGRRVVIPNADLFTESVIVNTAFDNRRSEYDVGIGVSDDPQRAREIILQTLKHVPGVLSEPPPEVWCVELGDFAVKLRVWWWTEPPRRGHVLDVQDNVLRAIRKALLENGIDLPYPTTQVLFHDQTEETDGDRARQREGWPSGNRDVPRPRSISAAIAQAAKAKVGRSNGRRGKGER